MLIVHRKVGQRIVIGDDIEIVVVEGGRGGARLGIVAPRGVAVVRGELRDAIVEANREAAETALRTLPRASDAQDTRSEQDEEPHDFARGLEGP